jgi:virulence factor Mce-like protein
MSTRAPAAWKIAIVAGFVLSCFSLLLFIWLSFGGPIPLQPKGYRVQVAFPDAATLATQADVRIAGVSVGKVVEKRRAPEGNRTLATIELDRRYVPIHDDARAMLRQKTLLGETYIEMNVGSRDAPILEEGDRLPDGRVAPAVEFDELLQAFDAPTRRAFQEWQSSLADATGGRSRELSDALGNLPAFVEEGNGVLGTLDARRRELRGLVRNTGRTFEALTRDAGALRSLVVENTRVMSTLAGRREALADSIRIFPTFLRESRATLRRLETFADDTDPLVRALDPVLDDAQPTLASLRRLAPDAERLFRDLDPLIDAGRTGLPALARVLRGLDPTLASTGPFLEQINPILRYLELNQATVSDFLNIGASALAIKVPAPPGSESNGHALPQLIVTGSQSLPSPQRSPDNRGNAYFKPGTLNYDEYKRGFFVFPNWDCAAAGGERRAAEETPGCVVQEPIPFQDSLRRFPHVMEALRGGRPRG